MKYIMACMLVGILAGYGIACENREAHESTQTTYENPEECGEIFCPRTSHKIWQYTCKPEDEHNCLNLGGMIKQYHENWQCQAEECVMLPISVYGQGKVTELCP